MKRIFGFSWLMVFFLTVGCAVHHNIPAGNVNIAPPAVQKIPLKVAVVVPDSNYVMTKNTGITETVPAGQLINELSRRVFPYVFREAEITSNSSYPRGIDAAVVLTLQDFRFTAEQVALGFGLKFNAEVSLKAVLNDEKGSPLWEHVTTSSRTSRSVVSPIIPMEQLKGESFTEALTEAFKELALEMERSREVRAYAASKSAPDAAPVRLARASASPQPAAPARIEAGNLPPLRFGTHAVVIGVDYNGRQDIPPLLYASQDARKVYDVLTDPRYGGVPKENAILLLNEQATRNGIVAALRKMKNWDGYTYLYYSGHGAPKMTGERLTDGYLVPADAVITDPDAMEDTSIKISYLQDLIDSSKAKGVLVALDACFSGGGKSVVPKGGRPLVGMLVSPEMMAPKGSGSLFVTSSAMNQQSWEDEAELKGGIFTHYLLEGLKGVASGGVWVKANEVAQYITQNVPQAARRLKGQEQHPQIRGKADFVVARNWEKAKVMDEEIARTTLKHAFEKGRISSEQLGKALDELRTPSRTKTLGAFLEGKIDERTFGDLY
ncbi:MAG: caspase family protein [Pseudomonadota bacterium]